MAKRRRWWKWNRSVICQLLTVVLRTPYLALFAVNIDRLLDNLNSIRERVVAAAARSGRTADAVTLIAVTKYVDAPIAAALFDAGCIDLGEARPQQLWVKAEALADRPVRWHLIGHLQRNKIERTLPLVSLIHSADSLRLIVALDAAATAIGRTASILLEVNISGDQAKHGFRPDQIENQLGAIAELRHVQVRGLMTMAGLDGDADPRRDFARLRELRDRLHALFPPAIGLSELSMGMSGDFEAAIEEGATIVRVGSALFEGIEP